MKLIGGEKRTAVTIIILVCVLAILIVPMRLTRSSGAYFGKGNTVYSVAIKEKCLALTFDVEYGTDKTEGIVEILKEFDADATFFLTGLWAENFKNKALVISEKFEIGTHSNTHPHLTQISYEECVAELKISKEKIERIIKKPITLLRAPYGEYNKKVLAAAQSLNLKAVRWDVDSYDWKHISSQDIVKRVLEKATRGSIILFHSNSEHILSFLPIILQTFKDDGYSFKRVSDLIK